MRGKLLADVFKPAMAGGRRRAAGMRHVSGLILFCCFIMGMGGGSLMVEVPEPVNNYAVTITDGSGLTLRLEKFSVAGETLFSGKLGLAEASVDFQKVDTVRIDPRADALIAILRLTDGSTLELQMSGDAICFGKSSAALVRIRLADIKTITIESLMNSNP